MKFKFTCILLVVLFITACKGATTCPEGINVLPMYGRAKKCMKQVESDQNFIKHCLEQFGDTKNASVYYSGEAWNYYQNTDMETAMKRFNQAWLLDSLNADVYRGFGAVLGQQGKTDEAIDFFNRSAELNPMNALVYQNLATAYRVKFQEKFDVKYLDQMVEYLKEGIALAPKNEDLYRMITLAYSHYNQKDSLNKYLKITDELNPNIIDAETRKKISN